MSIKWKTVKNNLPKMEKGIKAIGGKKVLAGVMGNDKSESGNISLSQLAAIHEYGCKIKVTDKMRGWLGAHGLHLKKETKEIVIPERSFLRTGFDECHEKVTKKAETLLSAVFGGDLESEEFYEAVGELLKSGIRDYAVSLKDPPKHPLTIEAAPGKINPLIQTGQMINAISWRIE